VRASRALAVPKLLGPGALILLVGLAAWVISGAAATPLAATLSTVAVLVLVIGIILFYRRGNGS
jgi:membrane protein implicated in regulation of membrane protease activity